MHRPEDFCHVRRIPILIREGERDGTIASKYVVLMLELAENKIREREFAFVSIIKICAKERDLRRGMEVHAEIAKDGLLDKSHYLVSSLISMYANFGLLQNARQVFEQLPAREVVPWSALIGGYAQQGQGDQALSCFTLMRREGLFPNAVTFTSILKACGEMGALKKGKGVHAEIAIRGLLEKDVLLGTALVDMYAKCGMPTRAEYVMEELSVRNMASWSALISGYAQNGRGYDALDCFERMKNEGFSPDATTYTCVLKACMSARDIEKGKSIHDEIVSKGLFEGNIVLATALVDMYSKCGLLTKAEQVVKKLSLRDIVCWSALISGYVQEGRGHEAIRCFNQMKSEGLSPNIISFICILKACGSIKDIDMGIEIHEEIVKRGLLGTGIAVENALLDMYVKCGMVAKAHRMLRDLPRSDVVSWNTVIAGYAQQGSCDDAIKCFEDMKSEGISPNSVTFVCMLKSCRNTGSVDKGKKIHDEIVSRGLLENDIVLGTALLDMYAKCGVLTKAKEVLENLLVRDVVSWSTLIAGYAQQGQVHEAVNCFERMQNEGLVPNEVTFLCILSGCGHIGLLNKVQMLFESALEQYGITPIQEHHICMVAVFASAGHFDKAMSIIDVIPAPNYPAVWVILLGACRKWVNVKLGLLAFDQVMQRDVCCAAAYVVMAGILSDAGMKEDADRTMALRLKYACSSESRHRENF